MRGVNEDNGAVNALDERIRELEMKKLEVKERIESLLVELAEESGVAGLKKRKYEVGYAPNDWSEEENT